MGVRHGTMITVTYQCYHSTKRYYKQVFLETDEMPIYLHLRNDNDIATDSNFELGTENYDDNDDNDSWYNYNRLY